MAGLFKRLFDIERHELARALLMFLYGLLLLSAYLILKPVRNSLFLDKFGADQLVYMYMIIAAAATPIAWLYGWTAARTSLPRLVGGTTAVLIVCMAIFWYLIGQQYSWLIYVFYVWVSLFGVFTTSQFWLLANYVFDAREAKRMFPFIGAGAIVGGMVGSALTSQLAELVGTANLLWFCVGFMLACFSILLTVWRMRQGDDPATTKRRKKSQDVSGMLPIIARSRHLTLLAIMIALTVIVSTFVDFQFNKVVKESFDDRDQLTAFFGTFFLALSVVSLVLQLLLSSRILRRFGIGAAILFLPVGLLLGSTAILLWPVLWSAIVVKISDGSFRYSINKTGLELLYLPVPSAIKGRIKAFMDVVGDRLARGVGGAALYLVNDILSWPVQWISFLSAVLISAWIFVAVLLKREYSRTFRNTLTKRTIDSQEIRVQLHDGTSIDEVAAVLSGGDRRQILFVLELLADAKDARLAEPLLKLTRHESAEVRRIALMRLTYIENTDQCEPVRELLKDEDDEVRAGAVRYLCRRRPGDAAELLEDCLTGDDPGLVAAAISSTLELAEYTGGRTLLEKHRERLMQLPGRDGVMTRRRLAEAIQFVAPDDDMADYIPQFLDDTDPDVVRSALFSVAKLRRPEWLPPVVAALGRPNLRGPAGEALLAYGPSIMGALRDAMLDPSLPSPVRLRLPKIISRMDTDEAAEILFAQIGNRDALLRFVIIKALNRVRRHRPDTEFNGEWIGRLIRTEAESYYRLLNYDSAIKTANDGNRSEHLLLRALNDGRQRHLEQAFRLAGLIYPINDMVYAFRGATSEMRIFRARAIEFLDTVWGRPEKRFLFPILERRSDMLSVGLKLFGMTRTTRNDAIQQLLVGDDLWVAACTANLVGSEGLVKFRDEITRLADSEHAVLRETARVASKALESGTNSE